MANKANTNVKLASRRWTKEETEMIKEYVYQPFELLQQDYDNSKLRTKYDYKGVRSLYSKLSKTKPKMKDYPDTFGCKKCLEFECKETRTMNASLVAAVMKKLFNHYNDTHNCKLVKYTEKEQARVRKEEQDGGSKHTNWSEEEEKYLETMLHGFGSEIVIYHRNLTNPDGDNINISKANRPSLTYKMNMMRKEKNILKPDDGWLCFWNNNPFQPEIKCNHKAKNIHSNSQHVVIHQYEWNLNQKENKIGCYGEYCGHKIYPRSHYVIKYSNCHHSHKRIAEQARRGTPRFCNLCNMIDFYKKRIVEPLKEMEGDDSVCKIGYCTGVGYKALDDYCTDCYLRYVLRMKRKNYAFYEKYHADRLEDYFHKQFTNKTFNFERQLYLQPKSSDEDEEKEM
eukprot:282931_1